MKKIIFALVALAAVVMTGCKKEENFKQCSLSVTEVNEHSITVRCEYVPSKKDAGYQVFLAYTDELTDEMREAMVKFYREEGACRASQSFTFDDLASNKKYCFLAVTFEEKDGNVSLRLVESIKQPTLASNDSRVTYDNSPENGINFYVLTASENYYVEMFDIDRPGSSYNYSAEVAFEVNEEIDDEYEIDNFGALFSGENCYKDGKMVCPFDFDEISPIYSFYGGRMLILERLGTMDFYGKDENDVQYHVSITVYQE